MIKIFNQHRNIHIFNALTLLIVSAPLTAQAAIDENNYYLNYNYFESNTIPTTEAFSYHTGYYEMPEIVKEEFFIDELYSSFLWDETVMFDVVETAKKLVGKPYVMTGSHPRSGFDCSGLVRFVYGSAEGVIFEHSATAQAESGTIISMSEAVPGDLVAYGKPGSYDHIGIYIGDGRVVHASSNGGVKESTVDLGRSDYVFVSVR